MLDRFCPLSKTSFNLPVVNGQYQAEWNSNQNQMKSMWPLYIAFQVLKVYASFKNL